MLTKPQEELLDKFADLSDRLFDLKITTTDSFTGELGEFIACTHFKLKKTNRVTRAVDGVCKLGWNYQVKAKIVSKNNFDFNIGNLDTTSFHYLVIVYFDRNYTPIKIIRIPSTKIKDGKISITSSFLDSKVEVTHKSEIKIPAKEKNAISEFGKGYLELEKNGIIRSRRVVGDIGELYACKRLNLEICSNKNEKGVDAKHKSGLTFEIKTRRVYQSERRISEARRLNNLDGKSADYLIVVVLDRAFKCAGMWLLPITNIANLKSAHLDIVNCTAGTLNLIPSKISYLLTGEKFTSADVMAISRKPRARYRPSAIEPPSTERISVGSSKKLIKTIPETIPTPAEEISDSGCFGLSGCMIWFIIICILCLLYFS